VIARYYGKKVDTLKSGGSETGGGTDGRGTQDGGGLPGSPFKWYIALSVGVSVLVHLAGRIAYRHGYLEPQMVDACTLGAAMVMLLSAALVMHHVYHLALITYATIGGVVCILAGQSLNVLFHTSAWGLQGSGDPAAAPYAAFKEACFVTGIALLFSVYLMSLFESNRARRSLAGAYADVERKVEERTASLVEANLRLEQEIGVRREAENAFRLSEEKFRALVENSADLILRLDRELHILYANPTVLKLAGRTPDDLIGRPVSVVLGSGPGTETWYTAAREAVALGKRARVETKLGDDGAPQLLDWSLAPEDDAEGRVASVLTVARDLTELLRKEAERRRLEEQLVQSHKLESVGRLAGGVAHDFNNLLQVICGYLELAMSELESDQTAHARLRQVDKAARRAVRLVRQLLAFSRQETMRCERIDLTRLIPDMAKMLQRVLGEQYQISIDSSPGLPPILADAGRVEQVMMNLCVNARDAMPAGGVIRIAMRTAHVPEDAATAHPDRRPGAYVETTVSDSGDGMPPEVLCRIFEPFFTTKPTGKGTGLGLAVVYGIVRQHGGFLTVQSTPGAGSSFSMCLPVAPDGTVEPDALEPVSPAPAGSGETILLAEDDEQVRDLTVSVLERNGYRVVGATNGMEAITLVEERGGGIALFILDAIMPLKTGRDVYDAIIKLYPGSKILFVTGHSFDTLAKINLPEQGYELLYKPLSYNALLTKVRQMLDSKP